MKNKPNLSDYGGNDFFWKDFAKLKNNPYNLKSKLNKFSSLSVFLTKQNDFSKQDYPLALGYMTSLVRMNQGKAKILVENHENYNAKNFEGHDLITFYPMAFLFDDILNMAKKVKKDFPHSKICFANSDQHQHEMILCNPRAKQFARTLLEENSFIDYVLVGEAEKSFIDLCGKINDKNSFYEDLSSCIYYENGKVKTSSLPIFPVDFNFLPFASRDFLEKHITPEGVNLQSPRVQSSRGCLGACLYCAESHVNITDNGRSTPVIQRNMVRFADEIEFLYNNYKTVFFNIVDSSFEDPGKKGVKRMNEFFNELEKRKINASFKSHIRIESFDRFNDEFIRKMKYSGIDVLIPGIESTIERELKSYKKKKINIDKDKKTLKRIDDFDKFFTLIGHMMFSSKLRVEDLEEKLDFMRSSNRTWDYLLMSHNVLVHNGTKYHDFLLKEGLSLPHDKLSLIIPYRYEDERVGYVSREMSSLRLKCPKVIPLHNLLTDSFNIQSRYYNKMNKHLKSHKEIFFKFKENICKIAKETGEVYENYFEQLISLAKGRWNKKRADSLYSRNIPVFIPEAFEKTKDSIKDLIWGYEEVGLSTNKLYLKTWMSLINSQGDSSGGKIEK